MRVVELSINLLTQLYPIPVKPHKKEIDIFSFEPTRALVWDIATE